MKRKLIGVGLATNVSQVCALNRAGTVHCGPPPGVRQFSVGQPYKACRMPAGTLALQ